VIYHRIAIIKEPQQLLSNDPKTAHIMNESKKKIQWLPIIAIIISVLSLGWNIINQNIQNGRIDELNEPKIVVDDAFMQYYNTISTTTHDTTDWGYYLYSYHQPDNTWKIPFFLAVSDSNKHFFNANFGFTAKDVQKQLSKTGYNGKFNIYKVYNPVIHLKNIGPTEAFKLQTVVDRKLGAFNSTVWTNMIYLNNAIDLNVNEKVNPPLEIKSSVDEILPDSIYFRINVNYMDKNKKIFYKTFYWVWSQSKNLWGKFSEMDE
jgi:hypothetical protein